ncbi:MAG: biotin-dependent carboxyltransferase family protein [Candidatus Accumulibacter sp.]|jgi:allophanate hydrolase|nr:biotin-dependent carboxyltransferase family protein [Accumulibacter sp.]
MNGLIEVSDPGLGNSLQDLGRFGYRHMGIAVSGCVDPILARCANALAGNPPECACVEVRGAGPALTVRQGRVRAALAGDVSATLLRAGGEEREIEAWRSVSLDPGDELRVGFVAGGAAYVAVSGGFATPLQLGSRSVYRRAEIGEPVAAGLRIPCAALPHRGSHEYSADPWRHEEGPFRVMLGPQDDHFKPEAIAALLGGEYRATKESDRMGARFEGAALAHLTPASADIVSDGTVPGAIQVPGNGQPIILLADCQTAGGYPKIATVISADLPRLAQLRPGQAIRFQAVDGPQARQALRALETRWKWWAYGMVYGPPGMEINKDWRAGWPLFEDAWRQGE